MDLMALGYQILLIKSILEKCLITKESIWYLDSGCLRHITGDKSKLVDLVYKRGGYVTYGDNNKGQILGEGCIKSQNRIIIRNVLYVKGLKHNLLKIRL